MPTKNFALLKSLRLVSVVSLLQLYARYCSPSSPCPVPASETSRLKPEVPHGIHQGVDKGGSRNAASHAVGVPIKQSCQGRQPIYSGRPGKDYGPHAEYLSGNLTLNLIGLEHMGQDPDTFEAHMLRLQEKYRRMEDDEVRVETCYLDDAELVVVAFGTSARLIQPAIEQARVDGLRVGMIRPITLWPFPSRLITATAQHVNSFLVVEMNMGQMIEDVRLAVEGKAPVHLFSCLGGAIPRPESIGPEIRKWLDPAPVHREA